jgi:class 3 adenylate cyclase
MTNVATWLVDLGLGQYAQAFAAHDIDASLLRELTDADLEKLGVASLGHRKRLLKAIAMLQGDGAAPATEPGAVREARLPVAPGTASHDAERRQLSVMFCDLVGSTALSTRMDAEDLRELVTRYHRLVSSVVARLDGFAAQFMGDGVMVFFGYPRAHEDDAERAVRAGLAVIDEATRPHGPGLGALAVRVGIATGPVVVGELGPAGAAQEHAAIGATPNLAARLQALAAPGTLVISAATRQATAGLFDYLALGAHELKGFAEPVSAWQVLGPSGIQSRFEARHAEGLAPLVGRSDELDLLQRRWAQAVGGAGQVVLVAAEPGVGKSRLVAALEEVLQRHQPARVRCFCSPHHTESPLHPFIAQLGQAAGLQADDDVRSRIDKIHALQQTVGDLAPQDLGLLCELLSVPIGDRLPPYPGGPLEKKLRTLAILASNIAQLSTQRPVMVIFEDAHWADPTSLDLLDRLVEQVGELPVLLVLTYRPEFAAPWVGRPHVTALTLSRLGRRDAAAIVERVAQGRALPAELLDQILERTEGVPLYVEELTRAVLEGGLVRETAGRLELTSPLSALAVPSSLQASLVARLDRLEAVKSVAQIGAAIGREFGRDLLAEVAQLTPQQLDEALDRLVDAGLVLRRGQASVKSYLFKHALVQDAVYGTLLRARRLQLHGLIAQAIEHRSPDIAATQPEVLARHLAEAGWSERAADAYARAGQLALSRSAHREAVSHLRQALEQLDRVPDSRERDRLEAGIQASLGVALNSTFGYASAEALAAFDRARQLMGPLDDSAQAQSIFAGLYVTYWNRAAFAHALEVAEEFLARVSEKQKPQDLCIAHRMLAGAYNPMGNYVAAKTHASLAVEHHDPQRDAAEVWRFTHDLGVAAKCHLAIALWHHGQVARSLALESEVLERANSIRHNNSVGYALFFCGAVSAYRRRDFRALAEMAARLQEHGQRSALPYFASHGAVFVAMSQISSGSAREGVEAVRGAIRAAEQSHQAAFLPLWLGILAEGLAQSGVAAQALNVLDEAIATAERTGERGYTAELWRLRAGFESGVDEGAKLVGSEAALRKAMEIARAQGSFMFELRAANDLTRVLADERRADEASRLLEDLALRARALAVDEAVQAEVNAGLQSLRGSCAAAG